MVRYLNAALLFLFVWVPQHASAWGDDGHMIIALLSWKFLHPDVRATIASMIKEDSDSLTKDHSFATEATWADKYRDSSPERRLQSEEWHFVKIEISNPDIETACFGRLPLAKGSFASNGPPKACVLDKINQFAAELENLKIAAEEKLMALKYILNLVGDMHQPLHAADNQDDGGSQIKIMVDGPYSHSGDNLRALWDNKFVAALKSSVGAMSNEVLANELWADIGPEQRTEWEKGSVDDWAREAFKLAKDDAYGKLPASRDQVDDNYVNQAEMDVKLQLSRAGVRLALLLNGAFAPPGPAILFATWFEYLQRPIMMQTEFTSITACRNAAKALMADRALFVKNNSKPDLPETVIYNPNVPNISAVCVNK
jgi:hypothetical protein